MEFFKMLIGSAVICGAVGYFYFKALYVLVPLFLITAIIESSKKGIETSRVYAQEGFIKKENRRKKRELKKLRKEFKEEELYEFDRSWRTLQQNRK